MAALPVNLSSCVYDDDKNAAAADGPKVTSKQAPAPEEEMAALPVNLSSCVYDDDKNAAAADGPKVTSKQAPAPEEEMAALPVNLSSCVYDDDENAAAAADGPKVTSKQAPAPEEEMAALPVNLSPCVYDDDENAAAADGPKEFTIRGSSLVDYSDTDETDEDCLNDQPLGPHCDEVVPKLRRTKSILMKKVPDFSDDLYDSSDDSTEGPSAQSKSEMALQRMHKLEDFGQPLSDSDESIVEDTDYEDSIKDYSDVQSDIEVVPKLRRAKSIQMRKVSKYSDALYNSSDDITEDTSTWSKSEMASQRPKRGCVHPRLLKLKLVHKRTWKMPAWQKARVGR
ncbi:uncharacterized protein LOC121511311 [Cheilinus undulatus]|uniref:uncharacterized protein LOC121511311 n=1 Tax=Cheilinus undulatus TaxID=241271 RepID=UPI001BD56592|nr:uncharacterized protein LOC121511311 [Cheilinus undulatus]